MQEIYLVDHSKLDMPDLLDESGSLKLLTAAEYDRIDHNTLKIWCHLHARYGLPTVELIAWLKEKIGGRHAIEIGAGAGDLCKHLGIRGTDSKIQEKNWWKELYKDIGQPVIRYPSWVKRRDAIRAILEYNPQVVVASWVTQWADPKVMHPPGYHGCIEGVIEEDLLATGVEYIFIGNRSVHYQKRILSLPHEEYDLPFIRSRAIMKDQNVVYIWKGTR